MQLLLDLRRAPQRTGSRRVSTLSAHPVGRLWKFKMFEVQDWMRAGGAGEAKSEGKKDGQ